MLIVEGWRQLVSRIPVYSVVFYSIWVEVDESMESLVKLMDVLYP